MPTTIAFVTIASIHDNWIINYANKTYENITTGVVSNFPNGRDVYYIENDRFAYTVDDAVYILDLNTGEKTMFHKPNDNNKSLYLITIAGKMFIETSSYIMSFDGFKMNINSVNPVRIAKFLGEYHVVLTLNFDTHCIRVDVYRNNTDVKVISRDICAGIKTDLCDFRQELLNNIKIVRNYIFIHGASHELIQTSGECAICLEDYTDTQQIKKVICSHYFHEKCINDWISKNSTCPLCRTQIV